VSYYLASAKPEKKVSNAFSNFFTKKADAKKAETPKPPAKSAKEKEVKPVPSMDASKKVNISGVSLILFEEVIFNKFCHFVFMLQSFIKVDVVLEEDKGFWSAVATFIQTTKRPILLTANDVHVAEKLNSAMEHLTLKAPQPVGSIKAVTYCMYMYELYFSESAGFLHAAHLFE
jgi:hypothetical protein